MADQANTPSNDVSTPDAAASLTPPAPAAPGGAASATTRPSMTRDEVVEAQVRRSPRYARFLIVGAVIGVIVAAVLAFGIERVDVPKIGEAVFSDGQVFGFLALIGIATGVLLAGVVALILDRVVGNKTRTVRVGHETTDTPR